MRYFKIVLIILFLSTNLFGQETKAKKQRKTSSFNHPYLIGGLGVVLEESYSSFDNNYNEGLCGTIGIEFPFTRSHITSFEFNINTWYAKHIEQGVIKNHPGFAFILNLYFLSNKNKLRPSISLGYIDWFSKGDYHGLGFGFGLSYELSTLSSVAINYDTYMTGVTIDGMYDEVPDFLQLIYKHRIEL